MGHEYKLSEIKTALSICVETGLEIRSEDGTVIMKSHIFENVGLRTKEE
jgi:hypothetical protein